MLFKQFLAPLDMTQTKLTERIGVPINHINEIKRKRAITVDSALWLERRFLRLVRGN